MQVIRPGKVPHQACWVCVQTRGQWTAGVADMPMELRTTPGVHACEHTLMVRPGELSKLLVI